MASLILLVHHHLALGVVTEQEAVEGIAPHQDVPVQESAVEGAVSEPVGFPLEAGTHIVQNRDPEVSRAPDPLILDQGPLQGRVLGRLTDLDGVEVELALGGRGV